MRAVLFPLLLLGACAVDRPSDTSDGDSLASVIGDRVAGAPQRCITPQPSDPARIVDDRTIVYGRVGTIYVNRLDHACPGLRPLATVIVERTGGQLCRNDHIRTIETGASIPGPVCFLGDFTPYRLRD